jgi:hypothetical protein
MYLFSCCNTTLMVSSQILCTCMHASHHANRERFIPVHLICEEIGSDVAQALPAAHALTWYNQQLVLNVKEIGVSNKIMQVAKDIPTLATFGTSVELEERLPASRTYALSLYGNKKRCNGEPCVNLDQLQNEQTCFCLHTNRGCIQTTCTTYQVPGCYLDAQ